jgi:hypothetical protein
LVSTFFSGATDVGQNRTLKVAYGSADGTVLSCKRQCGEREAALAMSVHFLGLLLGGNRSAEFLLCHRLIPARLAFYKLTALCFVVKR